MPICTLQATLILKVDAVSKTANHGCSTHTLSLICRKRCVGGDLHPWVLFVEPIYECFARLYAKETAFCGVVTYGNNHLVKDA